VSDVGSDTAKTAELFVDGSVGEKCYSTKPIFPISGEALSGKVLPISGGLQLKLFKKRAHVKTLEDGETGEIKRE
jgi:hypothetical protein